MRCVSFTAAAAALLALTACASAPPEPEPPLERPQTTASADALAGCGASDLASSTGSRLVPGPAGEGEVSVQDLPQPYRVVAPGTPTDLSFQPDRLTVTLSHDGIIRQITCG
ncbi:I78 family peptidase inhibitor [Caenispirillum bisanense]|uniref:I78 family peptidase inhibitor n=1 Tax=Caenispirillum bisanense TaxID=414052 RepID=UPI0031D29C37